MSKIDLYKGDCLEVMDSIEKESIDLIYIDPPFGIKQDEKFNMIAWKKTDYYEPLVYEMFDRILNENDLKFLSFLYPRLKKMKELLSEKGSIYVHIDWHVGHYVKILLDEIFGKENFGREIIWSFDTKSGYKSAVNNWIRSHDMILFYSKNRNDSLFNKQFLPYDEKYLSRFRKSDEDGRKYRDDRGSGVKQYLDELKGVSISDVWSDVMSFQQNSTSGEFLKYQTQKPEALLERIIKASSDKNSIVADFFGGSGTTIAVAKKLGRSGIYCDQNQVAYDIAKKRIEDTVVEK